MFKRCLRKFSSRAELEQTVKRIGEGGSLEEARRIHDRIAKDGMGIDRPLGHLLMGMYSQCKSPQDASRVFDGIPDKNLMSWTQMIVAFHQNGHYTETVAAFQSMQASAVPDKFVFSVVIAAHTQNGHLLEALALYWKMHLEGFRPDTFTLILLIRACTLVGALPEGRAVHASILDTPLESHAVVANCCITMFGKCGSVEDARRVFQKMKWRDKVSWNALLGAYTQHGHLEEARQLFQAMYLEGTRPDGITFVAILASCRCLKQGKSVHALVEEAGFATDHITANAVLTMYGRCHSVSDARKVFDELLWKSSVSWSAMLTVYIQHACSREAIKLWHLMNVDGMQPQRTMFLGLIGTCARLEHLEQGRKIHAALLESDVPLEPVLETSLVNMYGKCGSLEEAKQVLDDMEEKTVVSWNSMISAYAQHGRGKDALQLVREMNLEGCKPSKVTFVSTLDACASSGDLSQGKLAQDRLLDAGLGQDVELNNAIVSMHGKCGSLREARQAFDEMAERNVISWNAMLVAYSQHGHDKEVLDLFRKMDLEGFRQDKISYMTAFNSCACLGLAAIGKRLQDRAVACGICLETKVANVLINLIGKCGSLEDAEKAFEQQTSKDVISWNAMLTVYVQRNANKRALKLFHRMDQEGVKPDEITFVLVLDACAGQVASVLGRAVHQRAVACGFDTDDILRNAVMDMYGKCGNIVAARREFDKTRCKDVVCWTAMIAAYAQHGDAEESLKLFWMMQQDGVRADRIAFLCIVFACSHAGLLKDAFTCFASMEHDHKVKPTAEHYSCIIDLLGKSGWLDEAEELGNKVMASTGVSPGDVVTMRSLLGACAVHGDALRGSRAVDRIQKMNPQAGGLYVLLSNMYSVPSGNQQAHGV